VLLSSEIVDTLIAPKKGRSLEEQRAIWGFTIFAVEFGDGLEYS